MKKERSDEQLDQILRTALTEASPDDALISEIADSPSVWWSVKREIEASRAAKSPWPPVKAFWRALAVGVPTLAAAAVVISLFFGSPPGAPDVAATNIAMPPNETPVEVPHATTDEAPNSSPVLSNVTKPASKRAMPQRRVAAIKAARPVEVPTEIKTDFIALSYAKDPDSGQIVRVKVPSSMMVSVGLVQTVEKPTALVDAEVLVGDDGLTRAIRFIRN